MILPKTILLIYLLSISIVCLRLMRVNQKYQLYDIWDQVPVTYYQEGVKNNILQKIWHGIKINKAKEIIGKREFKNLLDVGCASGYMLSEIKKIFPGKKYFGVDIYDKAIEYAKRKYPDITFRVASAENLPYKDESFDILVCYETIEHVEYPLKTLREMKRVLRKGETCILTMDSGNWLFRIVWFVWENTRGRVWKGAHLHPFHHTELEQIIKDSGFKIREKLFSHWGMEVTFILSK